MLEYLEHILTIIKNIISHFGFWGIGVGMAIESACIPLPSEAVLPLGGVMVAEGRFSMLVANIAVNVGSILGSLLAYFVGKYGGRPFILKYGKYFFVSEKHFHQAEKTFTKYGIAAVFFGRLMPVVRTFISLPAGIARINVFKFVLFSLIGMIPWNATLIYCGYKFMDNYETVVRPIFKKFEYGFIAAFMIVVVAIIIKFKYENGKKNSEIRAD